MCFNHVDLHVSWRPRFFVVCLRMCSFWRFAHNPGSETTTGSLRLVPSSRRVKQTLRSPPKPSGSDHGGLSFSVSQGFWRSVQTSSLEAQPSSLARKRKAERVSLSAPGPRREVRGEERGFRVPNCTPQTTAGPSPRPDLDHGRAPARVSDPRTCTRPGNVASRPATNPRFRPDP